MRGYEIAAALAAIVALAAPTRCQETEGATDVMVYMTGASMVSASDDRLFRSLVDRMLARAGIRITWVNQAPKRDGRTTAGVAVHVRFVQESINIDRKEAFASSTPFRTGIKTIMLLCDHIRTAPGARTGEPYILAHVLAHELGHILQVSDGHSRTGVMKAHWDRKDFEAMVKEPLEFTPADLDLIREGLHRLQARSSYPACDTHGR